MSTTPQALAHRWFNEVWNNGTESAIDELMHPEAQCFDFPTPGLVTDREGFKAAVRDFRATFTGIQVTVDEVIAEDDRFAARWSATMTHTGPGLGFDPTGEPVALTGISTGHLRDGQIIAGWNALDFTSVVHKLNLLATR